MKLNMPMKSKEKADEQILQSSHTVSGIEILTDNPLCRHIVVTLRLAERVWQYIIIFIYEASLFSLTMFKTFSFPWSFYVFSHCLESTHCTTVYHTCFIVIVTAVWLLTSAVRIHQPKLRINSVQNAYVFDLTNKETKFARLAVIPCSI